MRLHLWGTDFRRGSPLFRRKLFLAPEERALRLREIHQLGFRDLVYLATCNRIEFYTTAPDPFAGSRSLWMRMLKHLGLSEEDFFQGYHFEGKTAIRHVMRVASSLESLVIGEPQILGQLKEALHFSRSNQLPVDSDLERVFQMAFEAAKRIRRETSIGEKPVSVATLGLRYLQNYRHQVPLTRAVIVGRSPILLQVIQWWKKQQPSHPLLWVNRTLDTIRNHVEAEGVRTMSLKEFLATSPDFSHLFTATSSPDPIFGQSFFQKVSCTLPKLVFDFAEPEDVEQLSIPSVNIVRLSDLREEAHKNSAARHQSVQQAETLIEASLRTFLLSQKEAPLIRKFNNIEPAFRETLEGYLAEIQMEVSPDGWNRVRKASELFMKKNIHLSREHLRHLLREVTDPDKATASNA